jgi:chitodextrinase
MRSILYSILLAPLALQAQAQQDTDELAVQTGQDGLIEIQSSEGEEAAFAGTIYKYVDFSNSKIIGQNTESNMQSIWGNEGLSGSQDRNPNDRIIIVDNDTVWSCRLPGIPSGNTGTQYKGPLRLNGVDGRDDTLTYACFTYYVRLDNNFDWSEGGKQPGLAGSNRTDCMSQNPPSGGLYGPDCGFGCDSTYCECAGFSARGGRQSLSAGGENELGIYLYHHNLEWRDCSKGKTYGYNLNMESRSDTAYKRGRWYRMTERIILNSVPTEGNGQADGIIELYKDDILVAKKTDVIYRNYSDIYVDLYYLSTLSQYDPDRNTDSYIWYDDFFLWADYDRSEHELGHRLNVPQASVDNRTLEHVDNTPPTIPSNVRVTDASSSSLTVTWEESVDDIGVKGYRIFVDDIIDTTISTLSYKKKGLVPESSYRFTVSSFDLSGNESTKSAVVVGITDKVDEVPPTVPTNIRSARITGYSIELEWDPSQDNLNVQSYEIRVNGVFEAVIPYTSYTLDNLDPETEYEITVRAIDESANQSAFSEPVSFQTASADLIAPTAPSNLTKTAVTETTIGLEWNPSTDNVSVTEYRVFVNNLEWARSTSTEATIARLEPGIGYDISVSATDEAVNESARSASISVTTRNNDIVSTPVLPEISIIDIDNKSNHPQSNSQLKSLGFAEIESFGLEVMEEDQSAESPLILSHSGIENIEVINQERATRGLQVIYNFSEGEGNLVKDHSGIAPSVDLMIYGNGINTEWLVGQGLRINDNTIISQKDNSKKLVKALSATNEVTVEAWIKQEQVSQPGPARLISLSTDNNNRAFTLGHEGNQVFFNYIARLNTSEADINGLPQLETSGNFTTLTLHHLVYSRNKQGIERIYVNGVEQVSGYREGDFSTWNDGFRFVLANELSGDRPWKGILYLVAVYDRALNEEEVTGNFNAGTGKIKFNTGLDGLKYNVKYRLKPFVHTDQGLIYGDIKNFKYENIAAVDSLFTFYPNPTDGNVVINIKNRDSQEEDAFLRLIDTSGKQHMIEFVDMSEGLQERVFELQLPDELEDGIYTLIFTMGAKSVGGRLLLIR